MRSVVKVNYNKALNIVKILLKIKLPLEKVNPYRYATPPGVKPLSIEHARYTIFHIPVHHQQKLITFLKRAYQNYDEMKELYNPSYVVENYENNLEKLASILKERLGVRFPMEAARRWYSLAFFLHKYYNDDPFQIFAKNNYDVLKILKEIEKVRGFGIKSKFLFLRLFKELGFVSNYKNYDKIEMPVDINDIHVSTRTGVIKFKGKVSREKMIKIIQEVWKKACMKTNADLLEMDRKLWFVGSAFCSKKQCGKCPLNQECDYMSQTIK